MVNCSLPTGGRHQYTAQKCGVIVGKLHWSTNCGSSFPKQCRMPGLKDRYLAVGQISGMAFQYLDGGRLYEIMSVSERVLCCKI